MNENLKIKIINLCKNNLHKCKGNNRHFSIILRRNSILSIGTNDYTCSHPLCKKHGNGFQKLHSEISALIRFRSDEKILKKCTLINLRINSLGIIGMSKPCKMCQKIIKPIDFNKIYYTNANGQFARYK